MSQPVLEECVGTVCGVAGAVMGRHVAGPTGAENGVQGRTNDCRDQELRGLISAGHRPIIHTTTCYFIVGLRGFEPPTS